MKSITAEIDKLITNRMGKNQTGVTGLKAKKDGVEVINTTTAYGLRNVFIQDTEPTDPKTNDLWIDTGV